MRPEGLAQRQRRAETGLAGDDLDRRVRRFEHAPGLPQPLAQQPLLERGARCLAEAAREMTAAHGGALGQRIDAVRLRQMVQYPFQHVGEAALAGFRR